MNYIKKASLLLALISLLLTVITINKTYAKYQTNVDAEADIKVARWHILVNNQDVRNNSETKTKITPTFIGTTHIKEGVIAPTASGYFDIIIDCSSVDVSFSYEITMVTDDDSNVKDFIVTGYSLNGGEKINIANGDKIVNNIYQKDNINNINIRVYVKWNDDEGSTMDNSEDAKATIEGSNNAKMNVSLNFKQIA